MIDPITAAAAATKAYATVRACIEMGKSIEDTFTVVSSGRGTVQTSCMPVKDTKNAPTH